MLRQLANSAESFGKPLSSLLQHLQTKVPPKVTIDRALKIHDFGGIKKLGLVANNNVLSKERLISVSATQAITGFEILDADQKTNGRLQEIAEGISSKYFANTHPQYYFTINLFKIIFQLVAQRSDPSLSVHEFAKFLNENVPKHVPLNWPSHYDEYILSSHLKNLFYSQKTYIGSLAGDASRLGLPLLTYEEMVKEISIVRSRALNFLPHEPKKFTKDTVTILCPVVDLINHSFEPNCILEGNYNYFENDSMIEVKAIKDIQPGEELTLNYGDMSNYEFFMKFGFLNDNNPFNEYPLTLDFGSSVEYTAQAFDLKHKIFSLIPNFQLEKINIYKDKIDSNMLATLRVYFLTDEDIKLNKDIFAYTPRDFKVKVNDSNERRIYELIIQNAKRELNSMSAERNRVLSSVKLPQNVDRNIFTNLPDFMSHKAKIGDPILSNIIQIGLEEDYMLKKNIEFCEKQLNSLSK